MSQEPEASSRPRNLRSSTLMNSMLRCMSLKKSQQSGRSVAVSHRGFFRVEVMPRRVWSRSALMLRIFQTHNYAIVPALGTSRCSDHLMKRQRRWRRVEKSVMTVELRRSKDHRVALESSERKRSKREVARKRFHLLKTPSFLLKLCTKKILSLLMCLIMINGQLITLVLWSPHI